MEQTNPSLACESCGASIPLTRVTRVGGYLRSIECQECRAVMTWSLAVDADIDLRDRPVRHVTRDEDEVAAPPTPDR